MKRIIKGLLCFLIGIATSCSEEQGLMDQIPEVPIDLNNPGKLSALHLLNESEVISLELTEESGIDNIDKVLVNGEFIFLINHFERSNNRNLLAFDRKGRFKWSQPANFDGPGNFFGYKDFILSENREIEILDGLQNKIIRYDFDGTYLNEHPVYGDAARLAKFSDGTYICHRDNSYQFGDDILDQNIVFMGRNGEKTGKGLVSILEVARDKSIWGERFFPSLTKDTYFFTSPLNDTIYSCRSGEIQTQFVIQYPEKEAKEAALMKLQEQGRLAPNLENNNLAFLEFLNNPQFISKYELIIERENHFWLTFRIDGRRYFVRINKGTFKASVFAFDDPLFDKTHIFLVNNNAFLLILRNPYLLREWWKKQNPQLVEKWFDKLEDSEPNPVLIVFDMDYLDRLSS